MEAGDRTPYRLQLRLLRGEQAVARLDQQSEHKRQESRDEPDHRTDHAFGLRDKAAGSSHCTPNPASALANVASATVAAR